MIDKIHDPNAPKTILWKGLRLNLITIKPLHAVRGTALRYDYGVRGVRRASFYDFGEGVILGMAKPAYEEGESPVKSYQRKESYDDFIAEMLSWGIP